MFWDTRCSTEATETGGSSSFASLVRKKKIITSNVCFKEYHHRPVDRIRKAHEPSISERRPYSKRVRVGENESVCMKLCSIFRLSFALLV